MVYINGVLINSNLWRCLMMCITLINGLVLINAYIEVNHHLQNLLMWVKRSWKAISTDIIIESFKTCNISNDLDSNGISEDSDDDDSEDDSIKKSSKKKKSGTDSEDLDSEKEKNDLRKLYLNYIM